MACVTPDRSLFQDWQARFYRKDTVFAQNGLPVQPDRGWQKSGIAEVEKIAAMIPFLSPLESVKFPQIGVLWLGAI